MKRRSSKSNLQTMFVLSPAFIDIMAIPLLVLASRHQHHYDSLPAVTRDRASAVAKQTPEKTKPHRLELTSDSLKLDGQRIAWDELPEKVTAQEPDSKLLVYVTTDAQGNGSISSLLRLSAAAAQHNFSSRVFVVSRESEDTPTHLGNTESQHESR